MQFLITVILCLALLFGAGGGTDAVPAMKTETAGAQKQEMDAGAIRKGTEAQPEPNGALVPAYYRYDTASFEADCGRLAACRDADEAVALYDELYEAYRQIESLSTAAYIRYSDDVADEYWSAESVWSETACADANDRLCTACRAVMDGPCAGALRAHVGDEAADYFAAYEEYPAAMQELLERESELVSEYYTALDAADRLEVEFQGRSWTMEDWSGEAGDELYWDDYDAFTALREELMKAANGSLGPIYLELVELRGRIAELAGYDNYAEYAYENVFCRDYGLEESESFCEQVRQAVSGRYYNEVYYNESAAGYARADMDAGELLAALGDHAGQIGGVVAEAYDFMTENGLYDIGGGSGRMDGCYTTSFSASGAPYIFLRLYGGSTDFYSMSHEFGHFVDARLNPVPNALASGGSYDLFEIHSNGLEVLYTRFYDDIFGIGAERAEYGVLADQLAGVIDGCVFDEFQRRIYEADELTLDDVNRIYSEVCAAFGEYDEAGEDYWWMYVPHNFESPMYYISYAASSLVALQLWDESREDYDRAVDDWLSIVEAGAYDKGYMQVLSECGLQSFADEGSVEAICTPVLDYLAGIG